MHEDPPGLEDTVDVVARQAGRQDDDRHFISHEPVTPQLSSTGSENHFEFEDNEDDEDRRFFPSVLELTSIGKHRFAAPMPPAGRLRLFGGLVASQCLKAAGMTVDAIRVPHSFHAYFTRPGRGGERLTLEVDEVRNGRTFATRQVRAVQNGVPILEMLASFQAPEPDPDRQFHRGSTSR